MKINQSFLMRVPDKKIFKRLRRRLVIYILQTSIGEV